MPKQFVVIWEFLDNGRKVGHKVMLFTNSYLEAWEKYSELFDQIDAHKLDDSGVTLLTHEEAQQLYTPLHTYNRSHRRVQS